MKSSLVIFGLLIPFFYGLIQLFIFQNVTDPIKYIYNITGFSSLIILFITITFSLIKKYINFMKYRKIFGLIGFFYAFLHFLNFYILDAQLEFDFMIKETLDKPFIYLGMFSFLILLFMAITSTKKLFKRFNTYHKLIYLSLVLLTIHFIMSQKSLDLLDLFMLLVILIISYFKLLQQILHFNSIK